MLIIFIFAFPFGCKDNNLSEQNTKIEFGSECGWCGGTEYITVTSSKVEYLRTIPCGDEKGTTKKERAISPKEWAVIINSFDYSIFKKLNYAECNVCADGCDEILKITENDNLHELRYSPTMEIKEIKELQHILKSKLEEMQQIN